MNHQRVSVFQHSVPTPGNIGKTVTSAGFSNYRTIVEHECCAWTKQLEGRFRELFALPAGWDGYNGQPLSQDCYSFTLNILNRLWTNGVPPPSLVPGGDGSLQLEWHLNQFDLEIDVLGVYDVTAMRHNRRTGVTEEIEVQKDFSEVYRWISDIAAQRLNQDPVAA